MQKIFIFISSVFLILNFSTMNAAASSFFGSWDYYTKCENKFYDLLMASSDQEEEDDASLIKAKISYGEKRYENAIQYAEQTIDKYSDEARSMQNSLDEYPWESKEKIFKYKSLNTVGLALFIKAKAYSSLGKTKEAEVAFRVLKNDYFYAQCFCKEGLFLKPSELAQEEIDKLEKRK